MAHPGLQQEHELYVCYRLGAMLFVPHFVRPEWVAPAYGVTRRTYTSGELEAMGARECVRPLWPRLGHDAIEAQRRPVRGANGR